MELYWLSPTDTRETEIANFSRWVMPVLSRACTVLNKDQFLGPEDAAPASKKGDPTLLPDFKESPGDVPLCIYNLGNSRMHCNVFDRFLEEPGLVILHDVNLVDFAQCYAENKGDYYSWRDKLCEQHGESAREVAIGSETWVEDRATLVEKYPLFKPYIKNPIGLVVHSKYAADMIAPEIPPWLQIRQLNLPYPRPEFPVPHRQYDDDVLRFVFCGHVGPNRRLNQFMEAWGRLSDPERIRLDLFGNISTFKELRESAEEFGVADQVFINGFVDDDELNKALEAAHFAVNLRWPTMGETSSSQLRYWAYGLPTIASNIGWYSEVPEGVLLRVDIDDEILSLQRLLQSIIDDPEPFAPVGQAGREYLEKVHSPDKYVSELLEFARERTEGLKNHHLEGYLVSTVASMCEDFSTLKLFSEPIETAVTSLTGEKTIKSRTEHQ